MEMEIFTGRRKVYKSDKRGKLEEVDVGAASSEIKPIEEELYNSDNRREAEIDDNHSEKQYKRDYDERHNRSGRGGLVEEDNLEKSNFKYNLSLDHKRRHSTGDQSPHDNRDRRGFNRHGSRRSFEHDDDTRSSKGKEYYHERRSSDKDINWRENRRNYDDFEINENDDFEKGWQQDSNSEDGFDSHSRKGMGGHRDGRRSLRDVDNYRNQSPNNTIMIKGLAHHITDNDLRKDILSCKLIPKDIRLIRKKDSGTCWNFAFVEFNTVAEAVLWMEHNQGVLMLQGKYRAVMYFERGGGAFKLHDWYCIKCGAHNFKRRDVCFKCCASRKESEEAVEGNGEVSPYPTHTVLLRNLDVLSTEETILHAINELSSTSIRSFRMSRDPFTNISLGVCYIDLNSVVESVSLYNALSGGKLIVDGRTVLVSYAKLPPQPSSAPEKPSLPSGGYGREDIPRLAEYCASMYATSPEEHAVYVKYYTQYYEAQIANRTTLSRSSSAPQTQTDSVNAAAAVALSAIQQVQAAKEIKRQADIPQKGKLKNLSGTYPVVSIPGSVLVPHDTVSSSSCSKYAVLDTSSYQYDKTSGYYYDSTTGLYYDATSQYYYNPQSQQFLYWDQEKQAYMPVQQSEDKCMQQAPSEDSTGNGNTNIDSTKKLKESKQDKVKVAKKIAKDMERWAKTLNQKKENQLSTAVTTSSTVGKSVGAADAGYAILERKERSLDEQVSFVFREAMPSPPHVEHSLSTSDITPTTVCGNLVAYGGGSDSEEEIEDVLQEERLHINWAQLACLLCKRQFSSRELLSRHQQLSDLHRQNLEIWYRVRGLDQNDPQQRNNKYRDRAKERRSKFGEEKVPVQNSLKEKYLKAREEAVLSTFEDPTKTAIGSENVGNRLLQKMGWQEGMGLGKANQGRTSIIKTELRSSTAGLGTRDSNSGPLLPGEKYKDRVKKTMFARYHELAEQDQGIGTS